jgi:hypothetical protein
MKNKKLETMDEFRITQGNKTFEIHDFDRGNEVAFDIDEHEGFTSRMYLKRNNLIKIKEHIDYLINK